MPDEVTASWIASIQNRDWEIYWKPESDYEEDWYDAKIESYLRETQPGKLVFSVSFVGDEDSATEMLLDPSIVRPRQEKASKSVASAVEGDTTLLADSQGGDKADPSPSKTTWNCNLDFLAASSEERRAWAEQIVGISCEIYWKFKEHEGIDNESIEGSAANTKSGLESEGNNLDLDASNSNVEDETKDEEDHEADWYEAHIFSTVSDQDNDEQERFPLFKVKFEGEDPTYEMPLQPDIVRPSARAWMRRTQALLLQPTAPISRPADIKKWFEDLPPDTHSVQDEAALREIRRVAAAEFPYHVLNAAALPDDESPLPTKEQFDSILLLATYLREQRYLRTKLAKIDAVDKDDILTDAYLDFLVGCLDDLEQTFKWFFKCWDMHSTFLSECDPPQGRFDPLDLFQSALAEATETLSMLANLDPNNFKSRKKRTAPQSFVPPTSNSTRVKRRKKNEAITDFWLSDGSTARGSRLNPDLEPLDFLSSKMVGLFVVKIFETDSRWYTTILCDTLKSVSRNIFKRFLVWEQVTKTYLGVTDNLVEIDQESSEAGSSDAMPDDSAEESPRFFSVRDVECHLDSVKSDIILRKFDVSAVEVKLREKLHDVAQFEARAWTVVDSVAKDAENVADPSKDSVYGDVHELLVELSNENSSLVNVDPIGEPPHQLSRQVIADVKVFREWIHDLCHSEQRRERRSFIENLESRRQLLPEIPTKRSPDEKSEALRELARRVNSLKLGIDKNQALYQKYEDMLREEAGSKGENQSNPPLKTEVESALAELSASPVVSLSEEYLTVRLDIMKWKDEASPVARAEKPQFRLLQEAFLTYQSILKGESESRVVLTRLLRSDAAVDSKVRSFAEADLAFIAPHVVQPLTNAFTKASGWKGRAGVCLQVLASFGNLSAGGEAIAATPSHSMVDIRRISELLSEYETLGVDIGETRQRLLNVYDASKRWSTEVTEALADHSSSSESVLSKLQDLGTQRPKGVIIDPTRHIVELLTNFLKWHAQTKEVLSGRPISEPAIISLMLQGIEVLQRFAQDHAALSFKVPEDTQTFLLGQLEVAKPPSMLLVARLDSNDISRSLLDSIVSQTRDEAESSPLYSMITILWSLYSREFLRKSRLPSTPSQDRSVAMAAQWIQSLPAPSPDSHLRSGFPYPLAEHKELTELLNDGRQFESNVTAAVTKSKDVLRNISAESVNAHLTMLKDLSGEGKARVSEGKGLVIGQELEQKLENDVKTMSWVARTLRYPVLHTDEPVEADSRIPWTELVQLKERIPPQASEGGEIAGVALRVTELYDTADEWQRDISEFTNLSLRGGKKRDLAANLSTRNDDEEESGQNAGISMRHVSELCEHPVLSKVSMPREKGIQEMLLASKKFEAEFHRFLCQDYDGWSSDKAAYPESGSLVGKDGTFYLYRLTGNPVFAALKRSIVELGQFADNIFAVTPGKAAFDWISLAVSWIDRLHSSVTAAFPPFLSYSVGDKILTIKQSVAEMLLSQAEEILFNVPEDLRRTLSQHKVFISTNKEGRFTVKSRKGGSHHAIGVVAIRWCPFLFDSLKSDLERLKEWKESVDDLSKNFISLVKGGSHDPSNTDVILRYHSFHFQLEKLQDEGDDLVVTPPQQYVEPMKTLLRSITSKLEDLSNPEILEAFTRKLYLEGTDVVESRQEMLDALASRQSFLQETGGSETVTDVTQHRHFRASARAVLRASLISAMNRFGVSGENEDAFCSVLAVEIENALFDKYQNELGESKISNEYRDKARTLRRSLENPHSLAFCGRVLSGSLGPSALVAMTAEDLASPSMKQQRSAAREQTNIVLTGSSPPPAVKAEESIQPSADGKPAEPIQSNVSSAMSVASGEQLSMALATKSLVQAKKSESSPPSAPPSLASGIVAKRSKHESEVDLVSNASGENRFLITIPDPALTFSVGFHEDEGGELLPDSFLPATLVVKGRITPRNLVQFVREKLQSKKWSPVLLRMSTFNDKDQHEYKRFCRKYEVRDRIAMINLGDVDKLYLLTPKFLDQFEGLLSFRHPTNAYGFLLVRKQS